MTTTRTPLNRPARRRITPEVVRLWKLCTEIEDAGLDELPEAEGGRWIEYFNAQQSFHLLIGWKPWECSPLYVSSDELPAWVVRDGKFRVEEWQKAAAIRRELGAC
jgi:hypothetical protein